MKTIPKQLILTFIFGMVLLLQSNARILTVASQSSPQVALYNTIQAAHDAAQSGDTIYVYPSIISYKGAVITKKVNIIGAGFNKVTDYSDCTKIISTDTLKFENGSDFSTISSLTGNFMTYINSNNFFIYKCKLNQIIVNKNITNVTIVNSIIKGKDVGILISENSFALISNNIVQGSYYAISIGKNGSSLVKNNILISSGPYVIEGYSAYLLNNIALGPMWFSLFTTDASILYSPFLNQWTDKNPWFVDYENQNYHLKVGSPGIGAGKNNNGVATDLGIYGGDYPFVDDGAPSLPTIYYINLPAIGNQKDGLPIEIKAKTN